jgi:hypothetical protein
VRPLAITALLMPEADVFLLAERYSVCDESNSCEKMWARGCPARTTSPVVLTSRCSIQPDTRVCTWEIRDSSGATVATARTVCVSDSRPTVSSRMSSD